MRTIVAAAALGVLALSGCAAADGGPSGDSRQARRVVWKDVPQGRGQTQRVPFWVPAAPGDGGRAARATTQAGRDDARAPEWRDVPQGRGQTRRIPFWVRRDG